MYSNETSEISRHRKRIEDRTPVETSLQRSWISLGRQVRERWLRWGSILENPERKAGLSKHWNRRGEIAATERRGR